MENDHFFWDLILRHRDVIIDECRRACSDRRDLLGDVISEAILALHRQRRNVVASQRHGAYLRVLARRAARRWLRREARRQRLPLELVA